MKFFFGVLFLILTISSQAFARLTCGNLKVPDPYDSLQSANNNVFEYIQGTPSSPGRPTESAAIYGKDNRELVNADLYPWRSILKFNVKHKECAGTIISKCHMLTARHCVRKDKENFRSEPSDVNLGIASGLAFDHGDSDKDEDDWAVVQLDSNVGDFTGYLSVQKESAAMTSEKNEFATAGFSADIAERGKYLSVDKTSKKIKSRAGDRIIEARADAWIGSSGGPMLKAYPNGAPYIAGIVTKSIVKKEKDGNVLQETLSDKETEKLTTIVSSSAFYDRMVKFMKKNPCHAN